MNTDSKQTVAVCILTYRRPAMLERVVRSVMAQEPESDWTHFAVVIDNDEAASGAAVIDELNTAFPNRIRYFVERRKGISQARNRALAETLGADFVAFIDDDEYAQRSWLRNLLAIQRKTGADVVLGPVHPDFESAPDWAIRGKFFAAQDHPSGAPVRYINAGNVLISAAVASHYRFDPRFDLTGGEDTHFFERVRMDGARFVWAGDAHVFEFIPAQRTRVDWVVRRAISNANRFTRACLCLQPNPAMVVKRAAKGIASVLYGIATLPGAVLGKHYGVRAFVSLGRGIGTLTALVRMQDIYYSD